MGPPLPNGARTARLTHPLPRRGLWPVCRSGAGTARPWEGTPVDPSGRTDPGRRTEGGLLGGRCAGNLRRERGGGARPRRLQRLQCRPRQMPFRLPLPDLCPPPSRAAHACPPPPVRVPPSPQRAEPSFPAATTATAATAADDVAVARLPMPATPSPPRVHSRARERSGRKRQSQRLPSLRPPAAPISQHCPPTAGALPTPSRRRRLRRHCAAARGRAVRNSSTCLASRRGARRRRRRRHSPPAWH